MARARKLESLDAYRRALKQGYGLGEKEDYRPWLTVNEAASRGTSAILRGWKIKREHHCLSQQEKYFFFLAEFSPNVVDIREQFPLLPLDLAMQLAHILQIKYPEIPGKKIPNVQSTDFLLTLQNPHDENRSFLAVSVKPAEDLSRPRVLEKLELERVWWQMLGVPFQLFVCTEALQRQALDIEWLTDSIRFEGLPDQADLNAAYSDIGVGIYPLQALVEGIQGTLGTPGDYALKILKCLIAQRYIEIDWSASILESKLVSVIGRREHGHELRAQHK